MADQENLIGYTVCEYSQAGAALKRTEFTDIARAEKAFDKAKGATVLFETRTPGEGLHWKKIKEKDAT